MIRKFVFIAAMILVGQAQADVCSTKSLLLMGPSWHSKEEISGRDVHNDTYGFGVGCSVDKDKDWAIYTGAYRNSFHDTSVFAAGVWGPSLLRDIGLGLGLGVVSGYDDDVVSKKVLGVSPLAFLNVSLLRMCNMDLGAIVIPPGEKSGAWVVNFNVRVILD